MKRATINKRKKPSGGYYHVVRYKREGGLSPYRENFGNLEEARMRCDQFNVWLAQGLDPETMLGEQQRRSITLREFYPIYRERHLIQRSRKYIVQQDGFFKHFCRCDALVDCPISEINKALVADYQNLLMSQDGMRPATANRHGTMIRAILQKAVEWDVIERNPLVGLQKLKEPKRRNVRLTLEEAGKLIEACPGTLGDIVEFAIYTGFRKENILSLRIEQVDIFNKCVELKVKGDKYETFPLFLPAIKVLERNIGVRQSGYVFLAPSGDRWYSVNKMFDRRVRKLGITVDGGKFRFHDLRHVFKRWLREQGLDLATVSLLMGHESVQMTAVYSDIDRLEAIAGRELMPEIRRKG